MKGNVKEYKRHDSRHVCIPTCILLRPMFPKDVSLPNIYATVYKMTILLISDPLNKLAYQESWLDTACDCKLLLLLWENVFLVKVR